MLTRENNKKRKKNKAKKKGIAACEIYVPKTLFKTLLTYKTEDDQ